MACSVVDVQIMTSAKDHVQIASVKIFSHKHPALTWVPIPIQNAITIPRVEFHYRMLHANLRFEAMFLESKQ